MIFSWTDFIHHDHLRRNFRFQTHQIPLCKIWSIFEDILPWILNFTISIRLSIFFISLRSVSEIQKNVCFFETFQSSWSLFESWLLGWVVSISHDRISSLCTSKVQISLNFYIESRERFLTYYRFIITLRFFNRIIFILFRFVQESE